MNYDARDVIARSRSREPQALDRAWANRHLLALMAAADVELGGRLIIEYADGWPCEKDTTDLNQGEEQMTNARQTSTKEKNR